MSFGLKNVEATYQYLMDKVFEPQIGRNIEVYVDDVIIKSNDLLTHIKDLEKAFG